MKGVNALHANYVDVSLLACNLHANCFEVILEACNLVANVAIALQLACNLCSLQNVCKDLQTSFNETACK